MPGALLLEQPEKKSIKLSIREAVFCRYYIDLGGNGTRAYMKAFKVTNYSTAAVESCRLLKNPNIQARLEGAKRAIEEKIGVTYGRLLETGARHLTATKSESMMMIPMGKSKKGEKQKPITDSIDVPDGDLQLKAADFLAKLCDFYPKKEAALKLDFEMNVAQIYLPKRGAADGAMEVVPTVEARNVVA